MVKKAIRKLEDLEKTYNDYLKMKIKRYFVDKKMIIFLFSCLLFFINCKSNKVSYIFARFDQNLPGESIFLYKDSFIFYGYDKHDQFYNFIGTFSYGGQKIVHDTIFLISDTSHLKCNLFLVDSFYNHDGDYNEISIENPISREYKLVVNNKDTFEVPRSEHDYYSFFKIKDISKIKLIHQCEYDDKYLSQEFNFQNNVVKSNIKITMLLNNCLFFNRHDIKLIKNNSGKYFYFDEKKDLYKQLIIKNKYSRRDLKKPTIKRQFSIDYIIKGGVL